MKVNSAILLFSLTIAIGSCNNSDNPVRTVVYRDGNTEDGFSESLEEFPPRDEWFRVRGGAGRQRVRQITRSSQQQQSQAISFGDQEVVVLPATASSGENAQEETGFNSLRRESNGQQNAVQVRVRYRGRVGLLKNDNRKNAERVINSGEQDIPRRDELDGEGKEDASDLPPLSSFPSNKRRQQNWHQHIRHENWHHRVNMAKQNSNQGQQNSNTRRQKQEVGDEEKPPPDNSYIQQSQPDVQQPPVMAVNRPDNDVQYGYDDNNENERRAGSSGGDTPPPHEEVAKMARYIVHNSNWTSMATISTMSSLKGYPFANIFSVSDGPVHNSSGVPYMYLTPLDMSVTDLENDSRASLTMSLAQGDYCRQQQYDPEDPRCAHVILSGNIIPVAKDEIQFARNSMYSRHPEMQDWPKDHGWFFAKMDIQHIVVLDYFGGAKTVTLDDYYNQL